MIQSTLANIAYLALYIAGYDHNATSVMQCDVMSWDKAKLAASKLIHACSSRWFSHWEPAADWPVATVAALQGPSGHLCHFRAQQMEAVLCSV